MMNKIEIPDVWTENAPDIVRTGLGIRAEKLFRCYTLTNNADEWMKIRPRLRARFAEAMNLEEAHDAPLNYREYGETKCPGYTVKNITYDSVGGRTVTGNLYIPDGKGPFPAVINMHGHWSQGRLAERVQERGHLLALSGFVVLAVDAFGAGERARRQGEYEYHGNLMGGALCNFNYPLIGIQATDNMRGVDLLCSLPFVDPERIGATGASGGGNQTMWLTAMDDRIKAGVPVVSVGSFCSYVTNENCICEVLPDGLTFSEEAGLLALAAPRAFNLCNAMGDSCPSFAVAEMMRTYKNARRVYQALGAEDNFIFTASLGPHGFHLNAKRAMLGFMKYHLQGKGLGRPCDLPAFETLPEEKVMIFKPGERPADFMTIPRFCKVKAAEFKKSSVSRASLPAGGTAEAFRRILKLDELDPAVFRKSYPCGTSGIWSAYTVEASDHSIYPVLVRKPRSGSHSFTLLSSCFGKTSLAESGLLSSLLDSDAGVILFDLTASGETKGDLRPEAETALVQFHNVARGFLWMGIRLMGAWTRDYMLMRDFALSLGAEKISAAGYGDAGAAALFASLYVPFEKVSAERMIYTFNTAETKASVKAVTMAMVVPGILRTGDLTLAAAATKAQTEFIELIHADGTLLSEPEQDAFMKEIELLKSKLV